MRSTIFSRELRVDGLSEADSLVLHVKNTVIVLEEVNTKVCFASVTSGSDLEDTVSVAIDHVLVFRDYIGGLVDCEFQVWHGVVLLFRALCAPEPDRVKPWLACVESVVHDLQEVLHGLLRQRDERGTSVWKHHRFV